MMHSHHGIGMTSARTRERLAQTLKEQGIYNDAVLQQIRQVPRHMFVDEALATRAYENTALPIGMGQTISQPYIVARMTEALFENATPRKVLEIGTGCGYQTAVLAGLVSSLYSVERIKELQDRAKKTLSQLNIRNVYFKHGDGFKGWAGHAPYDAILCAAAPTEVPDALLKQLAANGRLIIPIGPEGRQVLMRVTRRVDARGEEFVSERLGLVAFVPLVQGLR
ncbi:MAG TPA: protein-L-isoaspartate(D-aspartate) O-methyltransferase [Steroidobacteraceae bacterium]|nr:protein-L-isoaspartate(D-aspartate) O-methyltransferase [Steroidobacteraceae bacterium]